MWDFFQIIVEDFFSTADIRERYIDYFVESSWTLDGWVEPFFQVSCSDNNDRVSLFKTAKGIE